MKTPPDVRAAQKQGLLREQEGLVFGVSAERYRSLVLDAYRSAEQSPIDVIEARFPEKRIVLASDAALTDEGRTRLRSLLLTAAIGTLEGRRG